jgi:hypothetical protein
VASRLDGPRAGIGRSRAGVAGRPIDDCQIRQSAFAGLRNVLDPNARGASSRLTLGSCVDLSALYGPARRTGIEWRLGVRPGLRRIAADFAES